MFRLNILFAALVCACIAQAQQPVAYHDAYYSADQTNRPLIIALGADWCGPCHEMERLYTAQLRARGCYVHVNIDRDRALCQQLPRVPAIPAIIIYERPQGVWLRPRVIVGLPAIRVWLGLR